MTGHAAGLVLALAASLPAVAADPLAGRWQVNGRGAVIEFSEAPGAPGLLDVTYVDGPDLAMEPGTVIGTATPAPAPGTYDCRLYRDPRSTARRGRAASVTFTIAIDRDNGDAITFTFYSNRTRVSLWRWLPYLFRISVVRQNNTPPGLDGARRVGAPPRFIVI